MTRRSLLLVDDDQPFRERMAGALRARGFAVFTAVDLESAVRTAAAERPEVAIVDLRLPDSSGHDVARGIVAVSPASKLVILTGYGSIASAVEAIQSGVRQYLTKPLDADELVAAIDKLESGAGGAGGGGGGRPAPEAAATEGTPSLARAEWEHIQRVLGDAGGNVSEAARRLGIARRTLQLKLKKYPPKS
jgi:two-component system response regulator RegA